MVMRPSRIVVNPGRPPTRIGQDGIDPWVRIEDGVLTALLDLLRRQEVVYRVRPDGGRLVEELGDSIPMHRVSFPGEDCQRIQRIIDDARIGGA